MKPKVDNYTPVSFLEWILPECNPKSTHRTSFCSSHRSSSPPAKKISTFHKDFIRGPDYRVLSWQWVVEQLLHILHIWWSLMRFTWNLQICVSRGNESKSIGQMKVMWVAWLKKKIFTGRRIQTKPVIDPLPPIYPEPSQLGEDVDHPESLEVVDEDVRNPQAVDQLKVHWRFKSVCENENGMVSSLNFCLWLVIPDKTNLSVGKKIFCSVRMSKVLIDLRWSVYRSDTTEWSLSQPSLDMRNHKNKPTKFF